MRKVVCVLLLLGFCLSLYGCAHTVTAIQHREMQTEVKMSETIFIDPINLAKNKRIFVKVTNTSDMQEIQFEELIKAKLAQKGLEVVTDPTVAGFILQANVLYMGHERQDLTADGMLAGGFGGAIAGSKLGSGWRANTAGAAAGAMVGSLVGGLVASAIKIDTFLGTVDVQLKEKIEGGVKETMKTDAKLGTATTVKSERVRETEFQEYRTRIVAKAVQTNIDKNEAAKVLSDKLATQIAAMF